METKITNAKVQDDYSDDDEDAERQPLLSQPTANHASHAIAKLNLSPDKDQSLIQRCGSPGVGGLSGDIVQFSAPVYFADEEDDFIEVEVIRLGTLRGICSAFYATLDCTALQDQQYEAQSGQVEFEDGEHTKVITVKILEDGKWTPSTEFRMTLVDPQGCKLGMFQHAARVKLINGDAFPSNSYMKLKTEGEVAMRNVDDWSLFFNYLRFNYVSAGVKWPTLICLIFDQLSNIFLFVTLFVGVYMVDTIFARGHGSNRLLVQGTANDRYNTAVLIASWYVLPVTAMYVWDAFKVRVDIRGTSRKFLQTCMMRTYLQYTQTSQTRVSPTDLNVAMSQSADAVGKSYVAAVNIVRCMGKIIVVMVFIVTFQRDSFAICAVVLMPLLLFIFTLCHLGFFQTVQKQVDFKLREMLMLTHDACTKYLLAHEYFKRHLINGIFKKSATDHTETMVPVTQCQLRTVYITKFLSGCFIALYIVVKAHDVLDEKLSLGVFLATIAIFGTYLSDAITELNEQLNLIIESFTSLQEFTVYFNLPLELDLLKNISKERREATTKMRCEMHAKGTNDACQEATDAIPFQTEALTIRNSLGDIVLKDVNLEVDQGRLVAVVGQHGSGKQYFLQLLADIMLPTQGSVFIPAHLRVIHVSHEPMFLRMNLMHNLCLGLPDEKAVDIGRVKAILSLLHLDELIQIIDAEMRLTPRRTGVKVPQGLVDIGESNEMANSDPKVMSWLDVLSHSTRVKLHIARALVANPNVMVLQRPLHHFSEEVGDQVLDVLRLHVQNRGLGYGDANVLHRRPRSVFLIPDTVGQAKKADTIWEMDKTIRNVRVSEKEASGNILGSKPSPRSPPGSSKNLQSPRSLPEPSRVQSLARDILTASGALSPRMPPQ